MQREEPGQGQGGGNGGDDQGPSTLTWRKADADGPPGSSVGSGGGEGEPCGKRQKTFQNEEDTNLLESDSESDEDNCSVDDFVNYGPTTFFLQPYAPHDKLTVDYFNEDNVTMEARRVVEGGNPDNRITYKWDGPVRGKKAEGQFLLSEFVKWLQAKGLQCVKEHVKDKGNEEAQLVIIFGTLSFGRLLAELNDHKYDGGLMEEMGAIWGKITGGAADVITGLTKGVIGTDLMRMGKSLELENEELPCLSGLVLPKKAEGLGTKTFVVTMEENDMLEDEIAMMVENEKISLDKCKEILGITEEIEGKLKGILFFHQVVNKYRTCYRTAPIVTVIHTYLKANRHVAMAGGLYPFLLSRGTADDDLCACGVLVFGEDDRVRVNCAALLAKKMPPTNKKKIEKLKANLLTARNEEEEEVSSFGIMFGCYERGKGMHGRYGVETEFFNEHLPDTQLVGAFDYGEFYREILDGNGNKKGVRRVAPQVIHSIHLSAIFVVSYVHPKFEHED